MDSASDAKPSAIRALMPLRPSIFVLIAAKSHARIIGHTNHIASGTRRGARKVLTGFIGYQGKTLCFVTETTMTFEPKMVRSYYGIGHYNAREDADLISRAARYTSGMGVRLRERTG